MMGHRDITEHRARPQDSTHLGKARSHKARRACSSLASGYNSVSLQEVGKCWLASPAAIVRARM